eukprot:TRINITY_DN22030_c0_g1_i1.p1 TRINITY_DN22030_c0_g1~~TRINITY_DN22030_c0_g1_i1.p1  ORF type:complete len:147 (+),score=31.92 TRINITY_DN22030_c0_g1_i1:90-530(+)
MARACVYLVLISLMVCFATISAQSNPSAGLVRHVVTFRFLANVTAEERADVMTTYRALQHKCVNQTTGLPYIVSFDAGFPSSPEGKDQGMNQGYIVTFSSVADRNYIVGEPFYHPFDPYHDAFKKFVGPLLDPQDPVFVFDFSVLP